VLHVGATQAGLDDDGGVGANEHGDGAGTAGGPGVALGVEGDVAGDDDGVSAVPGGGLDPVDSVEEGVSTAVAGVDGVNALDAGVVAEELHEHGLDRLGLVQHGLGADLEAADGLSIDVVVLQQARGDGQGERVDVLAVVTEGHLGLAETDGVLASAGAIELLELGLLNILTGEVNLNGLDANVLRTGGHGGDGLYLRGWG